MAPPHCCCCSCCCPSRRGLGQHIPLLQVLSHRTEGQAPSCNILLSPARLLLSPSRCGAQEGGRGRQVRVGAGDTHGAALQPPQLIALRCQPRFRHVVLNAAEWTLPRLHFCSCVPCSRGSAVINCEPMHHPEHAALVDIPTAWHRTEETFLWLPESLSLKGVHGFFQGGLQWLLGCWL